MLAVISLKVCHLQVMHFLLGYSMAEHQLTPKSNTLQFLTFQGQKLSKKLVAIVQAWTEMDEKNKTN